MASNRIKFENYHGILYCEAMMDDEFKAEDLEAMRSEIREHFASCADVILKRVGGYSVASEDAQLALWEGIPEFRNFIYVIDNISQENALRYAALTYMDKYNTRVARSKEEAYAMLQESE